MQNIVPIHTTKYVFHMLLKFNESIISELWYLKPSWAGPKVPFIGPVVDLLRHLI